MLLLSRGRPVTWAALLFCCALVCPAQPDTPAQKSRHAKELMGEGRYDEAAAVYRELCRSMPSNAGLRLNLGLALNMAGRHREAIPQFETVLKTDPNSFPALLSLGAARLSIQDPARAIPPLEKVTALQPQNADARGLLAGALLSQGRAKEAAVHYRKLSFMTPGDPKAWYGLGRCYEALATRAFEELDKEAQGSAEWLELVAETRLQRRQYRAAFYFYQEALKRDPKLSGAYAGLAEVYRRSNHPDWADAEDARERAVPPPDCARQPPACAYRVGKMLEAAAGPSAYWRAKADGRLAFEAFENLGKLPPSVEMYGLRAEGLNNHGQFVEAAEVWRAALKLRPGDPELQRELLTTLYLGRDYEHVLPMLEQALKREPQSAELNFFTGDSYLHLEQVEKALPYLETAVRIDPKLLPARASLGLTYARAGRAADAIPNLMAALEIDEDGSLHYQLARAYQATGEADKASVFLKKYQDIQQRATEQKKDLEEKVQITAP
jgi:tetratricopeptide (TPR) repeat protein